MVRQLFCLVLLCLSGCGRIPVQLQVLRDGCHTVHARRVARWHRLSLTVAKQVRSAAEHSPGAKRLGGAGGGGAPPPLPVFRFVGWQRILLCSSRTKPRPRTKRLYPAPAPKDCTPPPHQKTVPRPRTKRLYPAPAPKDCTPPPHQKTVPRKYVGHPSRLGLLCPPVSAGADPAIGTTRCTALHWDLLQRQHIRRVPFNGYEQEPLGADGVIEDLQAVDGAFSVIHCLTELQAPTEGGHREVLIGSLARRGRTGAATQGRGTGSMGLQATAPPAVSGPHPFASLRPVMGEVTPWFWTPTTPPPPTNRWPEAPLGGSEGPLRRACACFAVEEERLRGCFGSEEWLLLGGVAVAMPLTLSKPHGPSLRVHVSLFSELFWTALVDC